MNRADAYAVLSRTLSRIQQRGYAELLNSVGIAPIVSEETNNGELVTIEVRLDWNDARRHDNRVHAVVLGPSTWRLERLEDSIIVKPTD